MSGSAHGSDGSTDRHRPADGTSERPGPAGNDDAAAPAASVFPGFREIGTGTGALVRSLAGIRRERGLTQTEVAALMGTSQSAVARLEAGRGDARLSTLERYAEALQVRLGFGVTGTEGHGHGGAPS